MGVPTKSFAAIACIVTILLSRVAPRYLFGNAVWITGIGVLFLQLFVYATWSVVLYPKLFSPLRHLPHPPGGSFFNGQFKRILKEPTGEPQREWMRTVPNSGLIRYETALNVERVLVTSAKGLAEVMTQKSYDFIKPPQIAESIGRVLGIGVLFAEGDEHKRQRKNLNPAFSFRNIKELYPVFWAKSREMVLAIEETISAPNGEKLSNVIDVGDWASRATLDIIGEAGLDRSFNAIHDPDNDLFQTYQSIFRPNAGARYLGLLGIVLPIWLIQNIPVKRNSDVRAASALVKSTCLDMIHDKRSKISKAGTTPGFDILAVAINSGGFNDDDLVNQLMTFLAAGHETTASAMTWAIYCLCMHPDIQTRLRTEIATLPSIHDDAATVTAADFEKLPFLSAVCNEVLRVYPPVPMTFRLAARDTSICDTHIPKGTNVILCPIAVNHSQELWGADAGEFVPERWMGPGRANSGGAESNYAFMTFLHGPRSCIGQGFAKAEFACLLAAWVASFETQFEVEGQTVEVGGGGVTSRPKGGLKVRVMPVGG